MKSLLLVFLAVSLLAVSPARDEPVSMSLRIENVKTAGGGLWIGIYESKEDFLDRERARLVYHPVATPGAQEVSIDRLIVGKAYAIGIFHDENGNGELDTNLLGLPTEPWAFSRPLRSWLRKPYFEEMSFVFEPGEGLPVLRLRG